MGGTTIKHKTRGEKRKQTRLKKKGVSYKTSVKGDKKALGGDDSRQKVCFKEGLPLD